MRERFLPLGIDIGTTAVRVADFSAGGPRLVNVLTANLRPAASEAQIAECLRGLLLQLGRKERRCVLVVDDRDAVVREVALPRMSRVERSRAARLEAKRFAPSDAACSVHVAALEGSAYAVGAAKTASIERLMRITRAAKLQVFAIDHAAYAYARVFTQSDAVIDVGFAQTRFYALRATVPLSFSLDIGGHHCTQSVARAFSIDEESAESRKRLHGSTPAGEAELGAITHFTGRAIRAARAAGVSDIERMTLVGNGARLPALALKIERDTGCLVEIATRIPSVLGEFPDDLIRAAAPEWSLACGAALWSISQEAAA